EEREAMPGLDFQGCIVEDERALIPGAADGDIAAREQPTGPRSDEFLELGASRSGGGLTGGGRGQLTESRGRFGGRIRQRRPVHDRPDVLGETDADSLARGEVLQCCVGLAQGGAMLVLPRGVEYLAVFVEPERSAALARHGAEALLGVNLLDARDRGHSE